MSYTPKNAPVEFSDDRERTSTKLRQIERQMEWKGDDWHFQLVHFLDEPIKVYSWFRNAVKKGEKLYFDASTKSGTKSYEFVKKNYIQQLLKSFGKIELFLAKDGVVIKSFNPFDKPIKNPLVTKILEKAS